MRFPINLRSILSIAATTVGLGLVGCQVSFNEFNEPPTRVGDNGPAARELSGQRTLVLGELAGPDRSPTNWKQIGPGMTRVLERTMLNHSAFDVVADPVVAKTVERLLTRSPGDRDRGLEKVRERYPDVRFVVTGKVTDFTHSIDKPRAARRHLIGARNDAVVAIKLNVIDLEEGRVVATDHVFGTVDAGRARTKATYDDLAFDSYLFWTTPLGRASELAAEEAMSVLDRLVPTRDDSMRIVQVLSSRRVRVTGGPETSWKKGDRYYVLVADAEGQLGPIYDPIGFPIEIEVLASSRINTTGLVKGRAPQDVLLGGVLTAEAPPLREVAVSVSSGALE